MIEAGEFQAIHDAATQAAQSAAAEHIAKYGDRDCCGFAWVEVCGVRSNSKLGKALISQGFRKMDGYLQLWNPSNRHTQSISPKEVGAQAYTEILISHGFTAYVGSRLD